MSEWALGEGDTQERTAYEYRELFLDEGLDFTPFRCPFCDVPLTSVNLYKTEEFAKAPHFRADKEPHRFGCDGSPKSAGTAERGPPRHAFEKREFHLPEALVPRRETASARPPRHPPTPREGPDGDEVDRRRRNAARRLGPVLYRTSLIRSVAAAFIGVYRESYARKKKLGWTDEQRRKWAFDLLKDSPLTLYDGFTLSYHNAIRNTRFPPPPKPRIFHGWALVTCVRQGGELAGYTLASTTPMECKDGGRTRHCPVEVSVRVSRADEQRVSQRQTLDRLARAAREGSEARWFAYGVLSPCNDGAYRMSVENIDHLYLHALGKPVTGS